jgi:Cysteine-rich secretory protein family
MRSHALCVAGCVSLFVVAAARTPHAEEGSSWLERLNFYRATASLPPVAEDRGLSGAVSQHARYMVMHDILKHSEDRRDSWATPEGAAAAAASNLAASTRPTEPDSWAIDVWMQAPFHALGILDPALRQVGFGIYRAPRGTIQTAAGLDVIRGRSLAPPSTWYPIAWPADGATVPLVAHTDEYPSPLTSCPGYRAPTGLPLIVQLGSDGTIPHVTASWIASGERLLEHCVFDEGTYVNHDAAAQQLGRSILAARNAIVLVPREPLRHGFAYRAVVDVNGRRIDWTFRVDGGAF